MRSWSSCMPATKSRSCRIVPPSIWPCISGPRRGGSGGAGGIGCAKAAALQHSEAAIVVTDAAVVAIDRMVFMVSPLSAVESHGDDVARAAHEQLRGHALAGASGVVRQAERGQVRL